MGLLIPNNGEADALQYFVNRAVPENLVLRLYQNNITPAETDTAAVYAEATFNGYGAITLPGATWSAPIEGAPSLIAAPLQVFTSAVSAQNQNLYGYYMTRAVSNRIALAERFADGPYNIANAGDQIKITPQITAD